MVANGGAGFGPLPLLRIQDLRLNGVIMSSPENRGKADVMKRATESAARALYKSDETINPKLIDPSLDVLKGKTAAGMIIGRKLDPVLSRRKVAEILSRSTKSVDRYCREGRLERVLGSGGKAIGIRASSVRKFTGEELCK